MDVARSIILQGLVKVPFTCMTLYQEDLRQMRKFLHGRYSTKTMVSKATVHTTLAQKKYTGNPMHG